MLASLIRRTGGGCSQSTQLLRALQLSTAAATDSQLSVWSFGSGFQGVLGTGSDTDSYEPEQVLNLPPDIVKLGAGHFTSFAITSEGQLYSWGRGKDGALGRALTPIEGDYSNLPGPVTAMEQHKIVSVNGSGVATFITTDQGQVYVFGTSLRGQLGAGKDVLQTGPHPRLIQDLPTKVKSVSSGWGHSAFVLEDGSLYTCGWPADGRLGHSFASSQEEEEESKLMQRCIFTPKKVEMLNGIKIHQVVCGMDHTLALAQDGTCFSFGNNDFNQLGRPSRAAGEYTAPADASEWLIKPMNYEGQPTKFKRVAAGLGHCLAVLADGSFASWGWNTAHQCGLGLEAEDQCIKEPTVIYGLPEARDAMIAAGRVHSVCVTDETSGDRSSYYKAYGRQWPCLTMCHTFGSSLNGRLGTGVSDDAPYPELVQEISEKGEVVLDLVAGYDHTLVLMAT